jgi:hypothetical protein
VKKTALMLVALLPLGAFAHHAMEFIEIESYSTPRRGEGIFHLHYDYYVDDEDDPNMDHWEITFGMSYGFTDRLMGDVHAHYSGFENGLIEEDQQPKYEPNGPSPFVEAVAFVLQYRLTEGGWIDVGLSGTMEIPFDQARDLLGSEEVFEGTLILSRSFGVHGAVVLNLTAGTEGNEEYQEYALGVKHPLTADAHGIAAGVEWLGEFEEFDDTWMILPGVYVPLAGGPAILKAGVGMGRNTSRASVTMMVPF